MLKLLDTLRKYTFSPHMEVDLRVSGTHTYVRGRKYTLGILNNYPCNVNNISRFLYNNEFSFLKSDL